MRMQMWMHGASGDKMEGWVGGGACGITGKGDGLSASLFPTPEQAAQIVRALAPFAGLRVLEATPSEGWDDPSADVMNAEADADAEEHLDLARPE